MAGTIQLHLKNKELHGTCHLSGSKSISNRLLIMAFIAGKNIRLVNLSKSDDTRMLARSLKQVRICSSSQMPMIIDARNSGTVFRFLTASLVTQKGLWHLTGTKRMHERPVKALVEALRTLGADIQYCCRPGYPPINIRGCNLKKRKVDIDASVSSQFISALMMIGPRMKSGLQITLTDHVVSFPYIEMTRRLMHEFGVDCYIKKNVITVPENIYQPKNMEVEPDWSSASYWYEVVALSEKAEVVLPGFKDNSVQGDRICAELFGRLGVHTDFSNQGITLTKKAVEAKAFEFDFTGCPDLVPAVMATCAAKKIPAMFKGIAHLRFKESDRIESLSHELSKIGTRFSISENTVKMTPGKADVPGYHPVFQTHADHRLAMCLAPLVQKYGQVSIENPEVVEKSYPGFWEDLKNIGLCPVEATN